eukprot:1038496-Amphidinium_carterae.1
MSTPISELHSCRCALGPLQPAQGRPGWGWLFLSLASLGSFCPPAGLSDAHTGVFSCHLFRTSSPSFFK